MLSRIQSSGKLVTAAVAACAGATATLLWVHVRGKWMLQKQIKEKQEQIKQQQRKHASNENNNNNEQFESFPLWVEAIVNHQFDDIDENMSHFLKLCAQVGANQCWHKHGTFTEHLMGVWRILVAWQAPRSIQRMGLFHSTYSNSWVSLALFQPGADRHKLRREIGQEAEELVHIMCSVPRMSLTFKDILGSGEDVIPEEGIVVQSIQDGQDLHLSSRMVCIYLLFHVADWADQFYGWQDELFNNESQYEGKLERAFMDILSGKFKENAQCLWPGEAKPGLYLSLLSRICRIIQKSNHQDLVPPIFNHSTEVLHNDSERKARDSYWEVVTTMKHFHLHAKEALETIQAAIQCNPYIAEPHAVLAQMYLIEKNFKQAESHAEEALKLFYTWGTVWDKRLSWDAWIAFSRMCLHHARKETWPETSMGMISIGVVSEKQQHH